MMSQQLLPSSTCSHHRGSGAFGISTALWLARSGYRDVGVLDMQGTGPAATGYRPRAGVYSTLAGLNKIVRFNHGADITYQRLAAMWDEWNDALAAGAASMVLEEKEGSCRRAWGAVTGGCGLPTTRLIIPERPLTSGVVVTSRLEFSGFELQILENMEKEGIRELRFRDDDEASESAQPVKNFNRDRSHLRGGLERVAGAGAGRRTWRVRRRDRDHKMDPCRRRERFGVHEVAFDPTAGFVYAYKELRVGAAPREEGRGRADPRPRAGGWSPSLLPEFQNLLKSPAGCVATIQIPKDREGVWQISSPENCLVLAWGLKQGKEITSFWRDENGLMNIARRNTRWTNFGDAKGRRIFVS
ncbi:hypothetical protein DL768_009987 [Monosporascus sp. mg162]|nr:hypothetical protein DL768_009987 [Monosporascus sp. mg162]